MNKHILQDSIATLSAVTWSFLTVAFVQGKTKNKKNIGLHISVGSLLFQNTPECTLALSLPQNSRKENKVAVVTAATAVLQHPYYKPQLARTQMGLPQHYLQPEGEMLKLDLFSQISEVSQDGRL